MMVKQEQFDALARGSRRAAGLTIVGALIVFGALAYSARSLSSLQQQRELLTKDLKEKQLAINGLEQKDQELLRNLQAHTQEDADVTKEIESLRASREQLQKEVDSLLRSKEVLSGESATLRDSLQKIQSETYKLDRPDLARTVKGLTPVSARVAPQASSVEVSGLKTSDGRQVFDFSLWLVVPSDDRNSIQQVSYLFNHPTFRQKTMTSADASTGFRIGYRGWGCLSSVIITITLKDGSSDKTDFDMCKKLWESSP
jgi:transcription initiation factor IIF auxiliary subunit